MCLEQTLLGVSREIQDDVSGINLAFYGFYSIEWEGYESGEL